jgi:WD40 repeat protein
MTDIPGGSAVVSPKGSFFATLDKGEILVHDPVSLKVIKRFPTSSMSRIAFSPDGNLIVQKIRLQGSRLPEHLIIDIKKDSVFESNDIPGYYYFDMFGRMPGTLLVKSSMAKKMIRSWDPQSFDPVSFSRNPRNNHLAVRLRQVTNHDDGFFQIWDMDKEEPLTPVIRAFDDEFGSISYSSDGKYLLTSESLILEPLSGKVIGVSDSPGGSYDFALSPDGKYIMKKLSDRVQLYDQASGYLVLEMQGARDIDFLPDCKHIIVSSDDETWVVDFPELSVLLKRTRERFKGTPLTLKERREYFLSEGITE